MHKPRSYNAFANSNHIIKIPVNSRGLVIFCGSIWCSPDMMAVAVISRAQMPAGLSKMACLLQVSLVGMHQLSAV